MKNFTQSALLTLALGLPVTAATPREIIDEQVPQARAILEAWQEGSPTHIKRELHIVYWTPSDRDPAPQYRERLTRVMESIRDFYAAEMKSLGFEPQTINLVYDEDELLKIHLVKAPKPYADYKPSDGRKIRVECEPVLKQAGIDPRKETILIFCNMSNWDPRSMRMTQNSPYYAGGNHRGGTAWQVDSPLLDPALLSKKEPIIHDGQYGKISVGKYNSIFVGGVAHELGHALGLPHNCERADERAAQGIALMGGGNRTYGRDLRDEGKGSFLTLASGLRCASHPMFTGSIKGMNMRGAAKLDNIKIQPHKKFLMITGKVVNQPGSPPVHAVLAYTDPTGGSNYDATTATAVPATDGTFTLHCTDLNKTGLSAKLRLIILYANGDATSHIGTRSPYTYSYFVWPDGKPDFSELTRELTPFFDSLTQRDRSKIDQVVQQLARSKNPQAAAITRRYMARRPALPPPAKIESETPSIALADATPASAKVGWAEPVYNRMPSYPYVLRSAEKLFTSGIYAHAPASHVYQLGGSWKKLTGSCGLASGMGGTVSFVIKADGKELWKSGVVKDGDTKEFDLDVTNVKQLELHVTDAGDGKSSDWGLWLEPTLKR